MQRETRKFKVGDKVVPNSALAGAKVGWVREILDDGYAVYWMNIGMGYRWCDATISRARGFID